MHQQARRTQPSRVTSAVMSGTDARMSVTTVLRSRAGVPLGETHASFTLMTRVVRVIRAATGVEGTPSRTTAMPLGEEETREPRRAARKTGRRKNLRADRAAHTAATTGKGSVDSAASVALPAAGAVEGARPRSGGHARWRRRKLQAIARSVRILRPVRADACVGQRFREAAIGRGETNLGLRADLVAASELSSVRRAGIACCLVRAPPRVQGGATFGTRLTSRRRRRSVIRPGVPALRSLVRAGATAARREAHGGGQTCDHEERPMECRAQCFSPPDTAKPRAGTRHGQSECKRVTIVETGIRANTLGGDRVSDERRDRRARRDSDVFLASTTDLFGPDPFVARWLTPAHRDGGSACRHVDVRRGTVLASPRGRAIDPNPSDPQPLRSDHSCNPRPRRIRRRGKWVLWSSHRGGQRPLGRRRRAIRWKWKLRRCVRQLQRSSFELRGIEWRHLGRL
jgi:hypothetical protein